MQQEPEFKRSLILGSSGFNLNTLSLSYKLHQESRKMKMVLESTLGIKTPKGKEIEKMSTNFRQDLQEY